MCHVGQRFDIHDITRRITDGLTENGGCFIIDQSLHGFNTVIGSKAYFDTLAWQHVFEQGVGTTIQHGYRNDIIALLCDIQHGIIDRRATCADTQGCNSTFKLRTALLQYIGGRVHDTGVNISRYRQVKQVGTVLGIVELIGDRLVDRHRSRLGGGVGFKTGVNGECLVFHLWIPLMVCCQVFKPSGSSGSISSINKRFLSRLVTL